MTTKIKGNYIDVTDEWMNKSVSFGDVKDAKYYEYNGKLYYVDGKNVVLDYSKHEKEVAILLTNTFGGTIYMVPRINQPEGIKTSDYIWNNEKWDLKDIVNYGNNVIDNRINNSKRQSNNFIINLKTKPYLANKIIKQVINLYNSKRRTWVDNIIIISKNKILKVYKKK